MSVPIPSKCWQNLVDLHRFFAEIKTFSVVAHEWPLDFLLNFESKIINFLDTDRTNFTGCDDELMRMVRDEVQIVTDRVQKVLHRDREIIANEEVTMFVLAPLLGIVIDDKNEIFENIAGTTEKLLGRITQDIFHGYESMEHDLPPGWTITDPGMDAPARKLRVINR